MILFKLLNSEQKFKLNKYHVLIFLISIIFFQPNIYSFENQKSTETLKIIGIQSNLNHTWEERGTNKLNTLYLYLKLSKDALKKILQMLFYSQNIHLQIYSNMIKLCILKLVIFQIYIMSQLWLVQ